MIIMCMRTPLGLKTLRRQKNETEWVISPIQRIEYITVTDY